MQSRHRRTVSDLAGEREWSQRAPRRTASSTGTGVLLFDNFSAGWRRFTWFVVQAIPAGTIHIAAIQSRAAQSLLREEAIIGAHGLVWFPSGEHPATGIEAAAAVLRLIGGGWRLVGSLLGLFSLHHRDRREPRHSPFTLE